MSGKITIKNKKGAVTVIDIEGVIGIPEQWQFDQPGDRIATYEKFRTSVSALAALKANEVIVNIRSTGGNVNDALLIYETLTQLDANITTRCYGYVASAATIIAQAASPGCREISSNSLYLIHKSVAAAEGNRDQISQTIGLLDQTDQRIASVYADRSGKPVSQFADLMCENNGNGRWLSPGEALGYALADRIIAAKTLPVDAGQMVANMGLPPVPDNQTKNFNFSKRWNAVLELLGIREPHDVAQFDENSTIDKETLESMALAQSEMAEANRLEVVALQNRISVLEAQNARLAAAATTTMPKEDPSHQESGRTPNEEAYLADVRRIR